MNIISEEVILNFFQLPKETIDELRMNVKLQGIDWLVFLNQLYYEFNPV